MHQPVVMAARWAVHTIYSLWTLQVCVTLSDGTNVSYGDLSSVVYSSAMEEEGGYSVVLEMMGDSSTSAHFTR